MPNNKESKNQLRRSKTHSQYPDFLDIQIKSFQDFFQLETKSDERNEEGLFNTFKENFPISDTEINLFLNFSIISWIHHDINSRMYRKRIDLFGSS